MRAARIENGLVADIWEVPSLDCFVDQMVLVEAPAYVVIGMAYEPGLGFPPDPGPSSQAIEALLSSAIQQRLDAFARQRSYDGILSACTYVMSGLAKFKAEAQACVNLRDATWSAAYAILAEVQAGTRPMPTSIADIEADLPALTWPS